MAQTKIEQGLLKFTEATDYLKIPTGTTAQRPSSPAAGYIRFNTTISAVETYDGTEWVEIGVTPPTFSSVDYPGSATALDPAGGESLVINGTAFNVGITVTIDGTTPSSITRNSATQLTVTTPAKTAGTYSIVFTNTDGGTATAISAVSYNGIPAFTNAAGSLGSVKDGNAINFSVAATEPDGGAITYAITSGSLPSGATLNTTTGAITGTAPSVNANTTSNFTITATDNENQTASRVYSITITPELPSDSFQVVTYTGTGSSQSITGVGFQPDFVWIKQRGSTTWHNLQDSTRGSTKHFYSNATNSEDTTADGVTSFDSDGFTLGGANGFNGSGQSMVAWCWKANGGTTSSNSDGSITSTVQVNASAGFSIVTLNSGGSNGNKTTGHGLGAKPAYVLFRRTGASAWFVYHKGLSDYTKYLYLQDDFDEPQLTQNTRTWGGQDFNTTQISWENGWTFSANEDLIAYCWAEVEGYSSFGGYTGNGSANGPIVETGFEPAYLMVKGVSDAGSWLIFDNTRNTTNPRNKVLRADSTAAETTSSTIEVDFLSNGFQLKGTDTDYNGNGRTYIYTAYAADPDTTAPTLADSFNTVTYSGNNSTQSLTGFGFKPSMIWFKGRTVAYDHGLYDSVRGGGSLIYPSLSQAASTITNGVLSFDSDGVTVGSNNKANASDSTYVAWGWKADDNEPTIFGSPAAAVYKFEDNANDVTGTYNGTASNVTYTSSGKFNKAAEFNGSSSYITLGSASSLVPTNFTFSAWVKTTSTSTDFIVGTNVNPYYSKVAVRSEGDGRVRCLYGNYTSNESGFYSTYNTINDGNWHHIVYFINQTTAKLYIDGSLDTTHTLTVTPTTNGNLTLGSFYNDNDNSYNTSAVWEGEIDQVRIYQGALDEHQVNELYNETASDNDDLTLGAPPKSIVSANANAGFSIVNWTGSGGNAKVPHGLSSAPEMIITKRLNGAGDWYTYHKDLNGGTNPASYFIKLNSADAEILNSSGSLFQGTSPTSTAFYVGNSLNASVSDYYIAYCFHSVSGYSKIGSYTGTGSSGLTVTTGFQPDFLMIKSTSIAGAWFIMDSARSPSNPRQLLLQPQSAAVEQNVGNAIDFNTDNFQILDTNASRNQAGATYIYMAFKIN